MTVLTFTMLALTRLSSTDFQEPHAARQPWFTAGVVFRLFFRYELIRVVPP